MEPLGSTALHRTASSPRAPGPTRGHVGLQSPASDYFPLLHTAQGSTEVLFVQQGASLASLRSNVVRGGETPGHQDPTRLATKHHHKHLSGHCFTQRSQKKPPKLIANSSAARHGHSQPMRAGWDRGNMDTAAAASEQWVQRATVSSPKTPSGRENCKYSGEGHGK